MSWLVIATVTLAVVAGVVREVARQRRPPWRFGVWLAAGSALMVLALRPTYRAEVDLRTAWVLTPGASPLAPGEPGRTLGPRQLSVALPGAEPWSTSTASAPDLATFLRHHPHVDRLRVLGTGLEPWQLAGLGPAVLAHGPPPDGDGIRSVHWPRRLAAGEELRVTGSVAGPAGSRWTVALTGPGAVDGASVVEIEDDGAAQPFTLNARPPGKGRFLYHLELADAAREAGRRQPLGVMVVAPSLPSILWLEDAPSFETKHVKTWLVDLGAELAIRSRVSRQRYHTEFHQRQAQELGRLTWSLLQSFDLVIVEQRAWNRLSRVERQLLQRAVVEAGLGVVVRLDPRLEPPGGETGPFGVQARRVEGVEMLRVDIGRGSPAEPLEIAPYELPLDPGSVPILMDREGRVLALSRPLGSGTVGVTLLRGTYAWALEGHPEALQATWRRLIREVARPAPEPAWEVPPGPILVDEPLEVTLVLPQALKSLAEAGLRSTDEQLHPLALRQDPDLFHRWSTTLWPASPGWHRLEGAGATLDFHVAGHDSWSRWQRQRRWLATRRAALDSQAREPGMPVSMPLPVPRLPFYLVVLVGLGLLWIDERRGDRARS